MKFVFGLFSYIHTANHTWVCMPKCEINVVVNEGQSIKGGIVAPEGSGVFFCSSVLQHIKNRIHKLIRHSVGNNVV